VADPTNTVLNIHPYFIQQQNCMSLFASTNVTVHEDKEQFSHRWTHPQCYSYQVLGAFLFHIQYILTGRSHQHKLSHQYSKPLKKFMHFNEDCGDI